MPYIYRRADFVPSSGPGSAIKKEAVELMGSIGLDVRFISCLSITDEDPEASEDAKPPELRLPIRNSRLRRFPVRLS